MLPPPPPSMLVETHQDEQTLAIADLSLDDLPPPFDSDHRHTPTQIDSTASDVGDTIVPLDSINDSVHELKQLEEPEAAICGLPPPPPPPPPPLMLTATQPPITTNAVPARPTAGPSVILASDLQRGRESLSTSSTSATQSASSFASGNDIVAGWYACLAHCLALQASRTCGPS